jgi:pseudouridine-5'-phosphate glycosidase
VVQHSRTIGALRPAVSDDVRAALAEGRPVVALESTLISHGLPWPRNLEVARASEVAVRECDAVPATVAVRDGELLVGMPDAWLEDLARARGAAKASRQNLAACLGRSGWAGTTVSATMIAADLAGIRVFATGGIGGVHRGALGGGSREHGDRLDAFDEPLQRATGPRPGRAISAGGGRFTAAPGSGPTLDVSADLDELARTPVVVVCSGPKSILDAGLTLEYLETRGVPVIGFASDELAGFWSRESGLAAPIRADSPEEVAAIALRHWSVPRSGGLLVSVPVPQEAALPRVAADHAIERALGEAAAAGIRGPATTPWLLSRIAELTGGRSVTANVALLEHNARVAAEIAAAISEIAAALASA